MLGPRLLGATPRPFPPGRGTAVREEEKKESTAGRGQFSSTGKCFKVTGVSTFTLREARHVATIGRLGRR